jgi:hypothetical protein
LQKSKVKTKKEMRLDMVFEKVQGPQDFSRENVLHTVAVHIVCDDQVRVISLMLTCLADTV